MKNDTGSILLEGIIVLPLYLVLFGGMCILGELTLGTIQNVAADRFMTSIWGDRFYWGESRDSDLGRNDYLFSRIKSFFSTTAGISVGKAKAELFFRDGAANNFAVAAGGKVETIHSPSAASYLVNAYQAVRPTPTIGKTHLMRVEDDQYRFFIVQKRLIHKGTYYREGSSFELSRDGYWYDIATDVFPLSSTKVKGSDASQCQLEYSRKLHKYAD